MNMIPIPTCEISFNEGAKAATLRKLMQAGFPVPPFVVIPSEEISETGIDPDLRHAILFQINQIGRGLFAVRSSAREEDSATSSHAGQFVSLLDVSFERIEDAALAVWRSGGSDGIAAYRKARRIEAKPNAPAVIVQRMVRARTAGILFGADPVSGRTDKIIISAVAGLGDELAGGTQSGEDYVVDRASGAIDRRQGHGLLSAADIAALVALAKGIESALDAPQDIEWAFEGNQLFLLQSRPITTKLRPHPVPDAAVMVFDNSNIVESYPGVVSPLTYSFAQYAYARVYPRFLRLLGVGEAAIRRQGSLFENMLARFDGRVYYNLINWYRMLVLLPGFAANRGHMETMMGVREPLPADIAASILPEPARGLARLREQLGLARAGLGLMTEALCLRKTIRAFHARVDRVLAQNRMHLTTLPLSALAQEYRRIEAELLEQWDAPLINDFLCMMAFGASRQLLKKWGGAAGLELHNHVMIGQGDIVSAEPAKRIVQMGRLVASDSGRLELLASGDMTGVEGHRELTAQVEAYLAKFGDRCAEEIKLESHTLREDPAILLKAIAAAARSKSSARSVRRPSAKQQLRALFPHRPLKRGLAAWVLAVAKARVRDRENLRFERTRVFARARDIFLAIGNQLHAVGAIDDPRDVFFLTVSEVLGAIEGCAVTGDLHGLITLRKSELEGAALRDAPPKRICVKGAALLVARDSFATGPKATSETLREGTACSAGTVRGRARIVKDPRRDSLESGEILIASHTDPGWIALFANAAAIVVERGSLLSHSAIVARELGIPCVVGLESATEWLQTGDAIEVNGATGTVRKVHA